MKKIMNKFDYIVSARTKHGNAKKRKCFFCKVSVYPSDTTMEYADKKSKKKKRYICYDCLTIHFKDNYRLDTAPESVKMFNMPKEDLLEITKIMIKAEQEKKKEEIMAG